MSDETFDMQGGSSPAPASEPAQPEPTAEPTPEVAEQSATPEVEAPAPEEGTRSNRRIRDLIAERDHYRELAELASPRPSGSNNSAPQPEAEESADGIAQLRQIFREEVSDIRAGLQRQATEREIDLVKAQFSDFDELLPEVTEVLRTNKSLASSANPIRNAYFMAKGMNVSEVVKAAKDAGRQEAYNTIAQKGQAAVATGAPRPSLNQDTALLERYRSGQLSEAERRAFWPKIVNAMSAE